MSHDLPRGFVQLTNAKTGRPVLVRADSIDAVEDDYLSAGRGVTIYLQSGTLLEVTEAMGDVLSALGGPLS